MSPWEAFLPARQQQPARTPEEIAFQRRALERHNPAADMNAGERLMAGVGQGFTSALNTIYEPLGFVSQDHVDDLTRIGEPLGNTAGGSVGSFAGEYVLPFFLGPTPRLPKKIPGKEGVIEALLERVKKW